MNDRDEVSKKLQNVVVVVVVHVDGVRLRLRTAATSGIIVHLSGEI
jgi:hypothetical protein